jgi:hypothetical protein
MIEARLKPNKNRMPDINLIGPSSACRRWRKP